MRKAGIVMLVICLLFGALAIPAAAKYPNRPIKLFLPIAPGGTTDIVGRMLASKMGEILGEEIVVTNVTGANGTICVSQMAASRPDGYTFCAANLPTVTTQPQMRELPYDPDELMYIGTPIPYEYMIIVRDESPWKTLEEFVEYAKANPGMKYGVPGTGSTNHLTMAWLGMKESIKWDAVPFKGNAPSLAALMGGHVDAIDSSVGTVLSGVQKGTLRPLVVCSENRLGFIPEVETLREKGYNFMQYSCMGFLLPKGTPENIRKTLEDALYQATMAEDVQAKFKELFVTTAWLDGASYKARVTQYYKIWGDILEELGLKKY